MLIFQLLIKRAGKNNFDIDTAVEQYKLGDTVRFSYVFLTSESSNPLRPHRNVGNE